MLPLGEVLFCNECAESREANSGSVLINKRNKKTQTTNKRTDMKTESITPEERTKGSDRYREDNRGGDGVQVSVMKHWCT